MYLNFQSENEVRVKWKFNRFMALITKDINYYQINEALIAEVYEEDYYHYIGYE